MTRLSIAPLIKAAEDRLSHLGSPAQDAEMLFRGITGMSRAALLANSGEVASTEDAERFEEALRRREGHEPIQYILGVAAFWRDDFVVNRSVLIPRLETEILIEAVAKRTSHSHAAALLDLGTGSGCIVLSLLRELPLARAMAVDRSASALEVAAENARRLGLTSRVALRLSRWFDAIEPGSTFDAIVSNPPYVARGDQAELPREVRDFEPEMALFAEASDDLSSYREITRDVVRHLKPAGLLAFEVGQGQASGVADLVAAAGLGSIEILDDLARIPRVVVGRRP